MDHRRLVLPDAHAALLQLAVVGLRPEEGQLRIAAAAGGDDADVHAVGRAPGQQIEDGARGREVGVLDPEPLVRRRDGQLREPLRPGRHRRADAAHEGRPGGAGILGRGKFARREQLAAGLLPVLGEGLLHLGDGGALDAHVGVAPLFVALAVAQPLVVEAEPAGEPDAPVHHHDFPVVARVPVGAGERAEDAQLAAGGGEPGLELVAQVDAAHRVEQHAAAHALGGAGGERLEHAVRRGALAPDVELDVDREPRAPHGLDERVEDAPVLHHLEAAARPHRRAHRLLQGGGELVAGRSDAGADLESALALPAGEAEQQRGQGQGSHQRTLPSPAAVHKHPASPKSSMHHHAAPIQNAI